MTNGERETFERVNFFQKPGHLNSCVEEPCRWSLITIGKTKFSPLSILIACSISDMCTSLWFCVKNILMHISGTKENGKFDHGENLDNDVRMFLTKYGCSKRWFI